MANESTTKQQALRRLLMSSELTFLMEAHDGISAKIAEEAGFAGLWASGLSMSTALGVRDANEASWSQVLDVLEYMNEATKCPILVDADTGYGNFNTFRRFVAKASRHDIAGVCIEDKLFPKRNSLLDGPGELADVPEFCARIRAGKDNQRHEAFCIVARTEALIYGQGMDEAIRRCEAYHRAGADAVLIHSKRKNAQEVFGFLERWGGRCPVVIVPTTYFETPTEEFEKRGASVVIWTNHSLRASVRAMRELCRKVAAERSVVSVQGAIAGVEDLFRLVGNAELDQAERRYAEFGEQVGRGQ